MVPWLRRRWALYKAPWKLALGPVGRRDVARGPSSPGRNQPRPARRRLGLEDTPEDPEICRQDMSGGPTTVVAELGARASPARSLPSQTPSWSPQLLRSGETPTASPTSPPRYGGDFTPMSAYGVTSPARRRRAEEDSPSPVRPRQAAQAAGAEVLGNVATRFVNSVIVMSFILHPVVVRPLAIGSVKRCAPRAGSWWWASSVRSWTC